ncbi:hypothetical protein, partial [Alistipes sp.]|uniref:hypothetical protein n=1 Tax=Alistipes sp. TaxID=1872444 RepID=UPI003AB1237A
QDNKYSENSDTTRVMREVGYGRAVLLALQNMTRSLPGWRRGRLFQTGHFSTVISNRHFRPFYFLPDGG